MPGPQATHLKRRAEPGNTTHYLPISRRYGIANYRRPDAWTGEWKPDRVFQRRQDAGKPGRGDLRIRPFHRLVAVVVIGSEEGTDVHGGQHEVVKAGGVRVA